MTATHSHEVRQETAAQQRLEKISGLRKMGGLGKSWENGPRVQRMVHDHPRDSIDASGDSQSSI
jgi:hypothetical protein